MSFGRVRDRAAGQQAMSDIVHDDRLAYAGGGIGVEFEQPPVPVLVPQKVEAADKWGVRRFRGEKLRRGPGEAHLFEEGDVRGDGAPGRVKRGREGFAQIPQQRRFVAFQNHRIKRQIGLALEEMVREHRFELRAADEAPVSAGGKACWIIDQRTHVFRRPELTGCEVRAA